MHIAEDLVRDRAAFKTNVLLFHSLNEVWVHRELEAMTDTLASEENGIVDLGIGPGISFSGVEVESKAVTKLHLCL